MAEVYKAFNTLLGNRSVAIKILSAEAAAHAHADKMRKLFIQEAFALSRVKDNNVVDVLDVGAFEDGTPYMVMEFLHGSDLGVLLKDRKQLPVQEAAEIMAAVCAGVYACHMVGIIHRDLKPANIFLSRTAQGMQPKVLDFSVAKVPLQRAESADEQSKTDLIVGTPTYMSPEQALGKPANELSDQYSIGALLYRCLTGRSPQGILPRPRDTRPDIPSELDAVILRAMEPSPDKRFGSVHELGAKLRPFASPEAQERWRAYYHAQPQPFDPTTGSISGIFSPHGGGAVSASTAKTEVVLPYDFAAHDRTTRLSRDGVGGDAPTDVESSPAGAREPASGSIAPTTVDLPLRPTRDSASMLSAPPSRGTQRPTERSHARPSTRMRGKIVAGFGAAATLVMVATIAAIRLGGHNERAPAPEPPAWTRSAPQPSPPSASVVSPEPPAATPDRPPPATAVNAPAPIVEPAARQPSATKTRKRRRAQDVETSIQYGAEGMPIIR
jgi:eukaryotic-like serine/threonine-protein kinase